MSDFQLFFDVLLSIFWIITYTLVLIGTVKYRFPLIPPVTQAIIAPVEFSVLLSLIDRSSFCWDYVSIAYAYWCAIEMVIIGVAIKKQITPTKWVAMGIALFVMVMIPTFCCVVIHRGMFFFTYLNTFTGVVAWLVFVSRRKDYPMNGMTLAIFIAKFLGDVATIPAYFMDGDWVIRALAILLPVCDSLFFLLYFLRRRKNIEELTQSEQNVKCKKQGHVSELCREDQDGVS